MVVVSTLLVWLSPTLLLPLLFATALVLTVTASVCFLDVCRLTGALVISQSHRGTTSRCTSFINIIELIYFPGGQRHCLEGLFHGRPDAPVEANVLLKVSTLSHRHHETVSILLSLAENHRFIISASLPRQMY